MSCGVVRAIQVAAWMPARADHDLLGQEEVQHLGHEAGVVRHRVDAGLGVHLAHQQRVVQPVRAGAADVVRPRVGVDGADVGAHVLLHGVQAHLMAAGQLELQHAAGGRQRAFGQHLGVDAPGLDLVAQLVEVGVLLDLVGDVVHAGLVRGVRISEYLSHSSQHLRYTLPALSCIVTFMPSTFS
jgi:hypothetical protein